MANPKNINNFLGKSKNNKLKGIARFLSIFAVTLAILATITPKSQSQEDHDEDDDLPTSSSSIMPSSTGSAPIISDDEDSEDSEED